MDEHVPNPKAAEASIELIVDDIADNAAVMMRQLNVVIAMCEAGDTVGVVYALRKSRAYWKHLRESAVELISADAERMSALRQEEGEPNE